MRYHRGHHSIPTNTPSTPSGGTMAATLRAIAALAAVLLVVTACGSTTGSITPENGDEPQRIARVEVQQQQAELAHGPEADATALAAQFIKAWSRRDLSQQEWWSSLDPLSTHELSGILRGYNPATEPTVGAVTPKLTTRDATSLTYTAAGANTPLTLTIVMQKAHWKVSNIVVGDNSTQPAS